MPSTLLSSPQVAVLVGPARSGKTRRLVEMYGRILGEGAALGSRLLWLDPSSRAAAGVRDELIDCGVGACLAPGVQTFADLARQIIAGSNKKARLISTVAERELLRRVVA